MPVNRLGTLSGSRWLPFAGPERQVAAAAELNEVLDAVDELDELSRSILVLRIGEDLSYQEIADTLGITLGQVKIRLLRARRAIAAAVGRGSS